MIEISEEKYWKKLNYYDGLLYISLLEIDGKNDWRMVKHAWEMGWEMYQTLSGGFWYQDDDYYEYIHYDDYINNEYWVIPVRDN